jgi:outer membrane protein OmpA-like peptidoglycan-associated protein
MQRSAVVTAAEFPIPRAILICGLTAWTAALAAGQGQDIEGGKDHPMISRYPGSWIVGYVAKEYDEYLFPTGKVESDQPTKSERLEGKITRITYQTPNGRSTLEVYRNFESALKQAGFQVLFSCAEPSCGSGNVSQTVNADNVVNFWNNGFAQRHLSAKLSRPEGHVYVSLHIANNLDGAPVAQLDIVEMKPMEAGLVTVNAESLAGDISRTGHASVYGIYFDTGKADVKPESDATLKEIAKLLQAHSDLNLYVVGHTDNQGGFDLNMDLSRRRGDAVVKVLTSRYGVVAARLRAGGDGPTAPVASNDTEDGRAKNRRVELVKQ